MVTITYFVRGTTTDNAAKLCSGWKQAELNDLGKEQAKDLGRVSKGRGDEFLVVFTSDLKRAIDSCNIAFSGAEKIIDKRLRECNYGEFDGKHKDFVKYEDHIIEPFPDGESLKDVEKRMRSFLIDVKEKYDGKSIAIVAHRAPQLALEVITKNKTWEQAIKEDWRKTGSWEPGWKYEI